MIGRWGAHRRRRQISLGAGFPLVGYLNLLFVWLAVHQLGYGYADGTLLRGGRRLAAALTGGGLVRTVLLVFQSLRLSATIEQYCCIVAANE